MIPRQVQHKRMSIGGASLFLAVDFATILQGFKPGYGGNDRTIPVARALVDAIDVFLGAAADIDQVVREFQRASYIQCAPLLRRKRGAGRAPNTNLVAYLVLFRAALEDVNPAWRAEGWAISPTDEAKEAAWLADEFRDEVAAGTFRLRRHSGRERAMTRFETLASTWLKLNGQDVSWSRATTEKAKLLFYTNFRNRLADRRRRGNWRSRRPN